MKFKSENLTQVSGSIGGVTYAHNRGGLYRRARSIPTNPNSAAQITVRGNFASLAAAWRDVLTGAERLAWENYAANSPVSDAFGDPLLLTGQQMYIRCNSVRQRAGAGRIDPGPTVFGLIDLTTPLFTASVAGAGVFVIFDNSDGWANEDNGGLAVQTSRFLSPTINFHRSPFRFQAVIDGDATTPPVSPINVGANNAYGQPVADATIGQRLFGRVTAFGADGRISPAINIAGNVIA